MISIFVLCDKLIPIRHFSVFSCKLRCGFPHYEISSDFG
jgi:hypothetical protein